MTTISALPTPPSRDDATNFGTRADAFMAALPTFRSEANTVAGEVNAAAAAAASSASASAGSASASAASATESATSATNAAGAANFKGQWNALAGALSKPAMVLHNGKYWMLLNDLPNVAASQPGVAGDWQQWWAIPNVAGNSGKFLTNNGTSASWEAVTGQVPMNGHIAIDSTANSVTGTDGAVYLKTGVSAATATYPNAMHSMNVSAASAASAAPAQLWNICYGAGVWVAVTTGSALLYSTDNGATWNTVSGPTVRSVCFGGGKFVAVGTQSSYTSTDGISWTTYATSLPTNGSWTAIGYGNGVYVAVMSAGTGAGVIATSTDGQTWTSRSNPRTNNATMSSAYSANVLATNGTGTWIFIDNNGSAANYSLSTNDGATWTSTAPAVTYDNAWGAVIYAAGLFVMSGSGTSGINSLQTSATGLASSWTQRNFLVSPLQLCTITYHNGVFCHLGHAGNVAYSSDAITWTNSVLSTNGGVTCFASNGTIALAMLGASATMQASISGKFFAPFQTSTAQGANSYGGKVLGGGGNAKTPISISFNSGKTFIQTFSQTAINPLDAAIYYNNLYVGAASGGLYTSTDAETWTLRTCTNKGGRLMVANGVLFSFSGSASTSVSYSSDGTTWNDIGSLANAIYSWVVYTPASGYTLSNSGVNAYTATTVGGPWSARTLPASLIDVRVIGSKLVGVTSAGVFYSSTDGNTWSVVNYVSGSGSTVAHTFSDGTYVYAHNQSTLVYVCDGTSAWARVNAGGASLLNMTTKGTVMESATAFNALGNQKATLADLVVNDRAEYTYVSGTTAGLPMYRRVA